MLTSTMESFVELRSDVVFLNRPNPTLCSDCPSKSVQVRTAAFPARAPDPRNHPCFQIPLLYSTPYGFWFRQISHLDPWFPSHPKLLC